MSNSIKEKAARKFFGPVSNRLLLLAASMLIFVPLWPARSWAQTVEELVQSPPLINVQVGDDWRYETEFLLSNVYSAIKKNDYSATREFSRKLLNDLPENDQVLQLAVHVEMRQQNWPEAEAYLTKLLNRRPDNLPLITRRGFVRAQLKRYSSAAADFERVLQSQPSEELKVYAQKNLTRLQADLDAENRETALGRVQLERDLAEMEAAERWDDMDRRLTAYLQTSPNDYRAIMSRGVARFKVGRFQAARGDFDSILSNPQAENFHAQAAEMASEAGAKLAAFDWEKIENFRSRGDLTGLEALLTEMLDRGPDMASVRALRGHTRYKLGGDYLPGAEMDIEAALTSPYLTDADRALIAEVRSLENVPAPSPEIAPPGPDWESILAADARLRDANDWDGLERFYTELTERYPDLAFGYSSRAYILLAQNRSHEARRDFRQALTLESNPQDAAQYQAALAEIELRIKNEEVRQELTAQENQLNRREDWRGLERLYDRYVKKNPHDGLLLAKRGYARLDIGLIDKGRADLEAALRLELDDQLRRDVNGVLALMAQNEAAGRSPGSVKADYYLARAAELTGQRLYAQASAPLARLEGLILSRSQTGLRDYLTAESLWAQDKTNEAYRLYQQAAMNLPQDFYLSETYAKMADYNLKLGHNELSKELIDQALAITPDYTWRNIQASNIYFSLDQRQAALAYYQRALTDDSLALGDIYFYNSMALAAREMGDRPAFDTYMRRHIDSAALRLAAKPDPGDEDRYEVYGLKKSFTDMAKDYGGSFYIFGNSYENDDYLSSFVGEVKKMGAVAGFRSELYFRVGGTLASDFSGTYYDPWSGNEMPYSGQAHFRDTAFVGLGGRFYPFDTSGFNLGLYQQFKIGRDTKTDTFLVANLFEAVGNDWEPIKKHWPFASIYGQVNYSTRNNDFTYGGDARLGHSFRLDQYGEALVTLTPLWACPPITAESMWIRAAAGAWRPGLA